MSDTKNLCADCGARDRETVWKYDIPTRCDQCNEVKNPVWSVFVKGSPAEPQNAATKALAIFREYHVVSIERPDSLGSLKPVTAGIHNTDDQPVRIDELMFSLILGAGVKDGDSFEILVRRTAHASPAIKMIRWVIDRVKGLVPVKLTPKKLIVPGPPENLN